MNHIELRFTVEKAFGNLHRARCVLIAAQDSTGDILVGSKPYFYPPTITRLLGGGVDEGESTIDAALREIQEELNISLDGSLIEPLIHFSVQATDKTGSVFKNETTVYNVLIGDKPFKPGDDVKSIIKLTPVELYELGEAYEALPETLWYKGEEGTYSWADYAKMYGPIHRLTAEKIQ